jgi:hypothetical protein
MHSSSVFSGVRVARSLVFYGMFYRSLLVLLTIVMSVIFATLVSSNLLFSHWNGQIQHIIMSHSVGTYK